MLSHKPHNIFTQAANSVLQQAYKCNSAPDAVETDIYKAAN